MARLDKIHDAVKSALIKDGWEITHDPYIIECEEMTLQADEVEIVATKTTIEVRR